MVDFQVAQTTKNLSQEVYKSNHLGDKVSLVGMLIGANAAGKTNIVRGLSFIRELIIASNKFRAHRDYEAGFSYLPFAKMGNQPTCLEVKFTVKNQVFIYSFKLNRNMILEEWLGECIRSHQRTTPKRLFFRKWNEAEGQYDFKAYTHSKGSNIVLPSKDWLPKKAMSLVASLDKVSDQPSLAKSIYDYWLGSVNLIINKPIADEAELGFTQRYPLFEMPVYNQDAEKILLALKARDRLALQQIETILRNLDIGFLKFKKHKTARGTRYKIIYKYPSSHEFSLYVNQESVGTQRLIIFLISIIQTLSSQNSCFLAVDDLNAYLHPELTSYVVDLFRSTTSNLNQSQLLFSSHCHDLMNELDKQQIFFANKDKRTGGSQVYRLDNVTGFRAPDNYLAKYKAGVYGGLPSIE